ncbi:flavin reductase [Syntrophorhabdus aromaticivorans]|jgi:flavin reductase (DIM6/NTAB) family NADH-FMN oxidoreductase RutF/rubredoxin|uniref:High molecular weight rubredoxin n=1 Tax=Syntrophorhabdus aromaticivorans TaxID=328301 RepID=A0A351U750_9BACT|nr:High molecular weight rubredoxin [Syntrophorhabdus aromaticivorans]HBA55781.1 High molecular weight rubredoxin [Syntrophorhabdus aromaticivorans]
MNTKAVQKICYGMYVISSRKGDKFNGQIANTLFQITSDPPTVAVSINKQNLTHEYIMESKVFAASIVAKEAPMSFIGHFGFKSGRDMEKLKGVNYRTGAATGVPIVLDNAIGYLECEVLSSTDVGTHTIFIGKVVDCDVLSDAEAMTYAYYHQIKGGKSPKTAPTYIKEEKVEGVGPSSGKYTCKVCGYVYDPANGDPDSGIPAGTKFEELPDTWVCPVCGAPKSEFERTD